MPNLPKTTGAWRATVKGKTNPVITGYLECWPAFGPSGKQEYCSVPGVSRYINL